MLFPISSSIMHSHFFRACKIIYSGPVVVRDANWTVDGLSPYFKIPNPSNRLKIHKHIFINISEFIQINISCDIKLKIFSAYVIFLVKNYYALMFFYPKILASMYERGLFIFLRNLDITIFKRMIISTMLVGFLFSKKRDVGKLTVG